MTCGGGSTGGRIGGTIGLINGRLNVGGRPMKPGGTMGLAFVKSVMVPGLTPVGRVVDPDASFSAVSSSVSFLLFILGSRAGSGFAFLTVSRSGSGSTRRAKGSGGDAAW